MKKVLWLALVFSTSILTAHADVSSVFKGFSAIDRSKDVPVTLDVRSTCGAGIAINLQGENKESQPAIKSEDGEHFLIAADARDLKKFNDIFVQAGWWPAGSCSFSLQVTQDGQNVGSPMIFNTPGYSYGTDVSVALMYVIFVR